MKSEHMEQDNRGQQVRAATPQQSAEQIQAVPVTAMSARPQQAHITAISHVLASINPVARVFSALLIGIPLLFSLDIVSATSAIILEVLVFWACGISPWKLISRTWFIWVIALGAALSVVFYGRDTGTEILVQWGIIRVSQGSLIEAGATALRVIAIAVPSLILALGMDPTDLADGLVQICKLSPRFVYGALASLRMMSLLRNDWAAIGRSRRSRGLGDGHAVSRVFGQAFSLLVMSIRRATKLATAMEARGFGAPTPRSHARVSALNTRDIICCALAFALPWIAMGIAFATGYWQFAFA